jgi:hypothetical protein
MNEDYDLYDLYDLADMEARRRELRVAEDMLSHFGRGADDLESYWFAGYVDRDGTGRAFEPKQDYEDALDYLQDQFAADIRTSGGNPIFDKVYAEMAASIDTDEVPLEIETGGRLYYLREHRRKHRAPDRNS